MCEPSSAPGRLNASRRKSAAVITQRVSHTFAADLLHYWLAHLGAVHLVRLDRAQRPHAIGRASVASLDRPVSRPKLAPNGSIGLACAGLAATGWLIGRWGMFPVLALAATLAI